MTDHPTTSWEAMQDGNAFYRRHQIYSIPGKLPNLGDFITAGCRYGGPLGQFLTSRFLLTTDVFRTFKALMRDTTKLVALGRATPSFAKAQIQIYSSAGEGILVLSVAISVLFCSYMLAEYAYVVGPGQDHSFWMDRRRAVGRAE